MLDQNAQLSILLDLEAKHNELLQRLEELDKRVLKTLSECLRDRKTAEKIEISLANTGKSLSG
jgi:hypothetical protein